MTLAIQEVCYVLQPRTQAKAADLEGYGTVSQERLYQLVREPGRIRDRTFEITFLGPGVGAYVFTFG